MLEGTSAERNVSSSFRTAKAKAHSPAVSYPELSVIESSWILVGVPTVRKNRGMTGIRWF